MVRNSGRIQVSIEHRPGARHGNADAMSRRDCACHHSLGPEDTKCKELQDECQYFVPKSGEIKAYSAKN